MMQKKKRWIIKPLIVFSMIFGLSACVTVPEVGTALGEAESGLSDDLSQENVSIRVNGFELNVDLTQNNTVLTVQSLNTEFVTKFINETVSKDIKIYIDGYLVKDEFDLQLDTISKDNTIQLDIVYDNASRRYDIQTLPDSFPTINLTNQFDSAGDYYIDLSTLDGIAYVFKMDNDGNIKYYYTGDYGFNRYVMNFQKWDIEGTVYYSFFEPELNPTAQEVLGETFGHIVLLNEHFEKIDEINLLPTDKVSAGPTENHEFILLGENHYLVTGSIVEEKILNGQTAYLASSYIQEVDHDTVVFEWLSSDYPVLFDMSVESHDYFNESLPADYAHINSLEIDPKDGNIIASFRNLDALLKINRDTSEIVWVLGGVMDEFGLNQDELFSRQHYAKFIDDSTILLFNNGNATQNTTLVQFDIDEINKTITDYRSIDINDNWSMATGAAQLTSDGYYIFGWGYGATGYVLSVVDSQTEKVVAEILTDDGNYAYRARKFE